MRELLVPIIGESGALVAQFAITIAVVLALIAIVYWLVRRFGALRIGGIGRGRVPRLAIVDAMAIDNRRRLVLVRRDAVEHLILIGGPADLVVESGVVRTRQRSAPQPNATPQQPTPAPEARPSPAQTPPPMMPPPVPMSPPPPRTVRFSENDGPAAPIPFPTQRANPARAPETISASFHPFQRMAAHANDVGAEPGSGRPPVAGTGVTALPPSDSPSVPSAPADPVPFDPATPSASAVETVAVVPRAETMAAAPPASSDLGGEPSTVPQAVATARTTPDDPGRVRAAEADEGGGLEAEMARLLGEITSNRSSS